MVSRATEETEAGAGCELWAEQQDSQDRRPQTVGAAKGYDNREFVSFCRQHGRAPHVAARADRQVECSGWRKEIGGLRRVCRHDWMAGTASRLVRMGRPRLRRASARPETGAGWRAARAKAPRPEQK